MPARSFVVVTSAGQRMSVVSIRKNAQEPYIASQFPLYDLSCVVDTLSPQFRRLGHSRYLGVSYIRGGLNRVAY
jgi:hypothetical protein